MGYVKDMVSGFEEIMEDAGIDESQYRVDSEGGIVHMYSLEAEVVAERNAVRLVVLGYRVSVHYGWDSDDPDGRMGVSVYFPTDSISSGLYVLDVRTAGREVVG